MCARRRRRRRHDHRRLRCPPRSLKRPRQALFVRVGAVAQTDTNTQGDDVCASTATAAGGGMGNDDLSVYCCTADKPIRKTRRRVDAEGGLGWRNISLFPRFDHPEGCRGVVRGSLAEFPAHLIGHY